MNTMTPPPAGALAYASNARSTASPARLLVMVYDRLLLDLDRAAACIADNRPPHEHLMHAQDIVMELLSTLDTSIWAGGRTLSGLYSYLHRQLIEANISRDFGLVAECREIIEPLRDAWSQAAMNPRDERDQGQKAPFASTVA